MGDRLRAGKISRYVTSHPGQLSLAIPMWVGAMSTILGWKGRCGVALAMRQTIVVYPPTGLTAYERDEHPAYAPSEYGHPPFIVFKDLGLEDSGVGRNYTSLP